MAEILCLDDYRFFAEMAALMLKRSGGPASRAEILPRRALQVHDVAPDHALAFVEAPCKFDSLLEILERVAAARGQGIAPA